MKYIIMDKLSLVLLLLTLNTLYVESIKFGGIGSKRHGSSGSLSQSKSVPTPKTPVGIHGGNSNHKKQTKATQVRTTPRGKVRPTKRGQSVTQPTTRYYPTHVTSKSIFQENSGSDQKIDHGVRNTALAGLGGSVLGIYLGHKLGRYTHSLNSPYGGYSVVHHYHHGNKKIVKNAIVEPNAITTCQDITICAPNTTALCMTNGTIYCVTPVDKTFVCNSSNLHCVNATITAPCLNTTDENCNSTELMTQNLEIPCVSNINIFGDFSMNKLSVQHADGSTGQSTLTNQGVHNRYCVTVIAEPFVEPKGLSNEEYVKYLLENPQAKYEAVAKVRHIMNIIGNFMFA